LRICQDALVLYATTMLLDSCTTAGRAGERAGAKKASGPIGPTWASICRRLSQPEDFMHALTHFDYNQVTPSKIAALHPFFSDPCYPKNVAARAVPGHTQQQTVYGLSIWCMSGTHFSKIFYIVTLCRKCSGVLTFENVYGLSKKQIWCVPQWKRT